MVDRVDFNDPKVFTKVLNHFQEVATKPERYFPLRVSKSYYFATESTILPSDVGWYALLSNGKSLYAGQAESLDSRLNSENGSRDQFANPQRTSDAARNFIKTFVRNGTLGPLRACVFLEKDVCQTLEISPPLSSLDRDNVEKFLNLTRSLVEFRK